MAWYWIIAIVVGALFVAILLFCLIAATIFRIKKNRKVKKFISYFDFAPENSPETMNYQLLKLINPVLRNKAVMLREVYEQETRILNAMKAGNGDYQSTIKDLQDTRDSINRLEIDFYNAINISRDYGFDVKSGYEDYLN